MRQKDDEMKRGGQIGGLIVEKTQLEQTLKSLTSEVEYLSNRNEVLLKDLKQKDFFE